MFGGDWAVDCGPSEHHRGAFEHVESTVQDLFELVDVSEHAQHAEGADAAQAGVLRDEQTRESPHGGEGGDQRGPGGVTYRDFGARVPEVNARVDAQAEHGGHHHQVEKVKMDRQQPHPPDGEAEAEDQGPKAGEGGAESPQVQGDEQQNDREGGQREAARVHMHRGHKICEDQPAVGAAHVRREDRVEAALDGDELVEVPAAANFVVSTFVIVEMADNCNEGLVYGLLTTTHNLGGPFARAIGNQIFGLFQPSLSDAANYLADTPRFRDTVAVYGTGVGGGFDNLAPVLNGLIPRPAEVADPTAVRPAPLCLAPPHPSPWILFGFRLIFI